MPDTREIQKIMQLQYLAGLEKLSKCTVTDEKERPWVEERTFMLARGKGKPVLTMEMVLEAFEKMCAAKPNPYKYFCTQWGSPFVTDEEVIGYFADNGSVVVIDRAGRFWNRGKLMEE